MSNSCRGCTNAVNDAWDTVTELNRTPITTTQDGSFSRC